MFNPLNSNAWFDFVIKGSAAFGFAWALWWTIGRWLKKQITRILRSLTHSDAMHAHFGHDPARQLHAIIETIRGSMSTDSMVMAICQSRIDLGIYICDPAGRCKVANKPLCKLFGLSQEQMLAYGWSMAIAEHEQRAVLDRWAEAVRGKSRYTASYTLQGTECYTEAEPVILDGTIHAYVGFVIPKADLQRRP